MTNGIIFDMDGVLIESEAFYFKRRMNFFKMKNMVPGSETIYDFIGRSEQKIWEILIPNDLVQRKRLRQEYLVYRNQHQIDFQEVLRPEVPVLLEGLKSQGIQMALASASPKSEISRMVGDCFLQDYFSYIISGEELVHNKPHPEIYLLAKDKLDCRCVAVEDSVSGIQAAKAANLYTIALKQQFQINQEQADRIINDLLEVLTFFDHGEIKTEALDIVQ